MNHEDKIRSLRAEKQALEKLMENAEFQRYHEDIELAYIEAEAKHESVELTPQQRAEWLYAMKKLRILKDRPAERLKTIKRDLASFGAME